MSLRRGRAFADRTDAGRRLAGALASLRGPALVVLGLPRGGVPVAAEVARELGAPLDVIVVRKLGVPGQPELAMGAVGEDGVVVVNDRVRVPAGVDQPTFDRAREREQAELTRRAARFRGHRPRLSLADRTAVVVDDGIATGSTARAACQVARAFGAARVVLAAPVGPPTAVEDLRSAADDVVVLETPERFRAVGQFYTDFRPTEDDEVVDLLAAAAVRDDPHRDRPWAGEVVVPIGDLDLPGHLALPARPLGVVVFAHGSGSSRDSPRNRQVAEALQAAGLGTLLFDLLTPEEGGRRSDVFDIGLLAGRLLAVTRWLREQWTGPAVPIGYFGASTGAAAALSAAAEEGPGIAAVVSRGGRPDLAGDRLPEVRSPTLLLVGGRDETVLRLNEEAQRRLRCPNRLVVVPGATHLFEEPGALDAVAALARDWFADRMTGTGDVGQPDA